MKEGRGTIFVSGVTVKERIRNIRRLDFLANCKRDPQLRPKYRVASGVA